MSDAITPQLPQLRVKIIVSGGTTPVDATLTKSGEAADAKAVGDALKAVSGGDISPGDALAVLLECDALPTLIDKHGAILTDKSGTILLG